MSKIYLPTQYLNKPCYVVNNDYIRVYESTNNNYQNTVYDIYFKNDYMVRRNSSSYSSNTLCDNINTYTDEVFYRYDYDKSLISFAILFLFIIVVPFKLTIFRFFRRLR